MRILLILALFNLASCYGVSFLEIPLSVVSEADSEHFHVKLRGKGEWIQYDAQGIADILDDGFMLMVEEGFASMEILPCMRRLEVVMFDNYEDFQSMCFENPEIVACQVTNERSINHSIDGWFMGIRHDYGFSEDLRRILIHEMYHAVLDCQGEPNRANSAHTNPGWAAMGL